MMIIMILILMLILNVNIYYIQQGLPCGVVRAGHLLKKVLMILLTSGFYVIFRQ